MKKNILYNKIKFFNNAVDRKPNNPFNYINLGDLYASLGNIEKALEFYLEALRLSSSKNMFEQITNKISLLKDNSKYQ